MKVTSIAKGTFISSHDTLEEAQKERKRLVRALPNVSKGNKFELFCEPYEGVWAVFMYKNLTNRKASHVYLRTQLYSSRCM